MGTLNWSHWGVSTGAGRANPSRFSRIWSEDVLDYANRFLSSPPTSWQTAPLPDLPPEEPPLEAIPEALQDVISEARDLVPLYSDREVFGEPPSEGKIVAHFVVPLLMALGWPTEQIAVKGRFIDVAVFRALPRIPQNCHFNIEGSNPLSKGPISRSSQPRLTEP